MEFLVNPLEANDELSFALQLGLSDCSSDGSCCSGDGSCKAVASSPIGL